MGLNIFSAKSCVSSSHFLSTAFLKPLLAFGVVAILSPSPTYRGIWCPLYIFFLLQKPLPATACWRMPPKRAKVR